jgi:hypothetical protein
MNEFEVKLEEFKQAVLNGDIVLVDGDGNPIVNENSTVEYVDLSAYWNKTKTSDDFDRLGDL